MDQERTPGEEKPRPQSSGEEQLEKKLTPEALDSMAEFAEVFRESALAGEHAFAMIATISMDPGKRPELKVRIFKQGLINPQRAFAACLKALQSEVQLGGQTKR